MEIRSSSSPRGPQEREKQQGASPTSNGSSSSSSNGSSPLQLATPPHTPTPKATRSHDANPYPTTFVQADTTTFKQVVQMLTGSSGGGGIPPIKSTAQKKQGFKLYERRNSIKNGLIINTFAQPARKPEILSPSILDFPALLLSPVTPINDEERAIADKKFYFHPSPRTTPDPPQLLPLFPLTSPRLSGH